ncbi:fructose-bisphosphate aldolase class I [bacterium]|nr:fructose-bisphosphate aldolase class I [bacterium]
METIQSIASSLLADGKGVLAADQSAGTIGRQMEAIDVEPSAENRRRYRELLFTTPDIEKYVSGVILHDSTIRNTASDGIAFVDLLLGKGIVPIIKVDKGTVEHQGFPGEVVTQGLDDLGERVEEYYSMGARAAKWRAVFNIGKDYPTDANIELDCLTLARYAAIAQSHNMVPIVEPEVIFKGGHDLARAEEVTTRVQTVLFEKLNEQRVDLTGIILKSNFVLAGSEYPEQTNAEDVAVTTIRTFKEAVPEALPGIVFLSGGQTPERSTANLNAVSKINEGLPWKLTFSFSRGLEKPAQEAWRGDDTNKAKAQRALAERLRLNSLALRGEYNEEME